MADVRILHNPSCSKSRQALALLKERDVDLEVVKYLDHPLTKAELLELLDQLDVDPAALVRFGEETFRELGIDKATVASADQVAALIADHPRLLERPVVISGGKAVIGRPTEHILDVL